MKCKHCGLVRNDVAAHEIVCGKDAEIGALRRELERLQPDACNAYLEDNLCLKKKGHAGECLWFPF